MRAAAILTVSVAGLTACTNTGQTTPETVEMAVAKSALSGCMYDILPKSRYQIRQRGEFVIRQTDVTPNDGIPVVRAVNGASPSQAAAINNCVRARTLASPTYQSARGG